MLPTDILPGTLFAAPGATRGPISTRRTFERVERRTGRRRPIGLGGSLFQVFPFETRRSGEARTSPPRTVGYTSYLLGNGRASLTAGEREAVEVILRHTAEPCPPEAAKDKVVFCSRAGETLVFQADRQKQSAALCACGNASATAAALLGNRLNQRRVRQDLHLPDGRLETASTVTPLTRESWRVEQTWIGIRFQVQSTVLGGRQVAVCRGSFNDYLVVGLPSEGELEQFELPEVIDLWRQEWRFSGFVRLFQL